jgi:hypothetical protein
MQIDTGIPYTVAFDNFTAPASVTDILQIATSATVPLLFQRLVVTAGVTTSNIIRVQLMLRTSGGTGGTGVTARPMIGSAAASSTCSYNVVTTQGAAGNIIDDQQWNNFAPYEFNQKPAGIFVPPSGWISFFVTSAPAGTFPCSFTAEFVELK